MVPAPQQRERRGLPSRGATASGGRLPPPGVGRVADQPPVEVGRPVGPPDGAAFAQLALGGVDPITRLRHRGGVAAASRTARRASMRSLVSRSRWSGSRSGLLARHSLRPARPATTTYRPSGVRGGITAGAIRSRPDGRGATAPRTPRAMSLRDILAARWRGGGGTRLGRKPLRADGLRPRNRSTSCRSRVARSGAGWSPDGRGLRLANAGGRGPVAREPQDPSLLTAVIDPDYL
jgi:hypothetical protein